MAKQIFLIIQFALWIGLSESAAANEKVNADQFWVRNTNGSEIQLTEVPDANTQAIVVIAMDRHCPVVVSNIEKISRWYKSHNQVPRDRTGIPFHEDKNGRRTSIKYPGDKVKVIGIYVEPDLGLRTLGSHVTDYAIPFPVFQDSEQKLIRALGITRLSEVCVLDRNWTPVYRGPFDDQLLRGRALPEPKNRWVADVVEKLLQNEKVDFHSIKPEGCLITEPVKRQYPRTTFYGDLYPILERKCTNCHREGAIGPMPFENYDDVLNYAAMIEEVIVDERMPPFPATSPKKFAHTMDSYQLTKQEKSTFLAWLRADHLNELGNPGADGKPDYAMGDASKIKPPIWPDASKWKIGKPDFVFEMKEPMVVPATGVINYAYVPVKIPEAVYNEFADKDGNLWIQSIETKPGAPEVVHHIQILEHPFKVTEDSKGMSPLEQLFAYGPSVDGANLLGGFTPGNQDNAQILPENMGKKIKAGSNLLFELHYTTCGKETRDRSKVGIRFRKTPPEKVLDTFYYFRKRGDFRIPARMSNHSMQDYYHFGPQPVKIHGLRFHQHVRGKSVRLEIVDLADLREAGNGSALDVIHNFDEHDQPRGERLLSIPVWDFNWQITYKFGEPIIVKPSQVVLATAYWDNSNLNRANPDSEQDVPWGQQTEHEMFNTLFQYEKLSADDPLLNRELVKVEEAK